MRTSATIEEVRERGFKPLYALCCTILLLPEMPYPLSQGVRWISLLCCACLCLCRVLSVFAFWLPSGCFCSSSTCAVAVVPEAKVLFLSARSSRCPVVLKPDNAFCCRLFVCLCFCLLLLVVFRCSTSFPPSSSCLLPPFSLPWLPVCCFAPWSLLAALWLSFLFGLFWAFARVFSFVCCSLWLLGAPAQVWANPKTKKKNNWRRASRNKKHSKDKQPNQLKKTARTQELTECYPKTQSKTQSYLPTYLLLPIYLLTDLPTYLPTYLQPT